MEEIIQNLQGYCLGSVLSIQNYLGNRLKTSVPVVYTKSEAASRLGEAPKQCKDAWGETLLLCLMLSAPACLRAFPTSAYKHNLNQ